MGCIRGDYQMHECVSGKRAENETQIKNTITLSQYVCLKEFSHFALKVQSLTQSFSTLFHFCKNCPGRVNALLNNDFTLLFFRLGKFLLLNFRMFLLTLWSLLNICGYCKLSGAEIQCVWQSGDDGGHALPNCAAAAVGSKQTSMRRNGSWPPSWILLLNFR